MVATYLQSIYVYGKHFIYPSPSPFPFGNPKFAFYVSGSVLLITLFVSFF